jgi:methyl-accepting chemotaxis protein
MDTGRDEVEKGIHLVEEANAAMDSIVQFSNKCLDMVQQIAASCEQQSAASDEISSSMEGIAKLTTVTMTSSGRIEHSSKELRAVSDELLRAASWFKVNSDTQPATTSVTKASSDVEAARG